MGPAAGLWKASTQLFQEPLSRALNLLCLSNQRTELLDLVIHW